MNGNTSAKISEFLSSLGISDTPFKVGYLQMFSVIRGLSPTSKSEKRVVYEMDKRGVPFTNALHPPGKSICDRVYRMSLNTVPNFETSKHNEYFRNLGCV